MNVLNLWLAALCRLSVRIYAKADKVIFSAIDKAIFRAVKVFLFVDLLFYLTEHVIWGYAFPHYGDAILASYLVTELVVIFYFLAQIRLSKKTAIMTA